MKVEGFIIKDRCAVKKWEIISLAVFIAGIIIGCIYLVMLPQNDNSISAYLSTYIKYISSGADKKSIFLNSLSGNLKIFAVIFSFSFIKFGIIPIFIADLIKGFSTGFTVAAFFKFCFSKAILSFFAMFLGMIIFSFFFIMFVSNSVCFFCTRKNAGKSKIINYILLSICYLTIFCATSFFDGFVTTTFMKFMLLKIA